MERIWLKHYPPGVPATIDPSAYSSLAALFAESFAKFRDRQAFVCMGGAITYGETDEMSRALGAWLQNKGLKPGARVAVMMPNTLQYPIAVAAILRAGFVVVNFNPLYTPRELEHQLKDSGAEAVIVLENFAASLQGVIGHTDVKHIVVTSLGDLLGSVKGTIVNFVVRHVKKMVPAYSLPHAVSFNAVLAAGRKMTLREPAIGGDDIAFLQYTGGTTGVAKGATLLHRNVVANTLQVDAWLQPLLNSEPRVDQLRIVTALPLYHVFALTACLLKGIRIGAVGLLIPNPRDIPGLIKELRAFKPSAFPAVNTLYNALLNHPDFKTIDWSQLKYAVGGGMAVQRAVAERWLKATGRPIIEGYGLSETSPVLTCNTDDGWSGTIGLPLPSTDISIRDDDNREMPLGESGEICAHGPQVMQGYWQRPDETALVMTPDGFFRTGDIGVMDANGRVTIVDRKKDMISVSGLKVFPNEVEAVYAAHPGVLENAVIGVPDQHSGEAVKLFVVRKDPNLSAEALIAFGREQLAHYKVPKQVEFRDELPKTNVGKILRRALRPEAGHEGASHAGKPVATPAEVLAFWREAGPDKWFNKDDAFDAAIRAKFLTAYEAAAAGTLATWESQPESLLALLIVLDQFPRNMFRNNARTFAADPLALAVAKRAVAAGNDQRIAPGERQFVYLPFEHSENPADQDRGLELFAATGDAELLKWAQLHADIIRRFGRFPHRNAMLGRTTTAEEQAFLDGGGFKG